MTNINSTAELARPSAVGQLGCNVGRVVVRQGVYRDLVVTVFNAIIGAGFITTTFKQALNICDRLFSG